MKKQVDYFIKDEGEFFTIGFISDKAKELINLELINNLDLYNLVNSHGEEVIKLDMLNEHKNSMITWAVSHNLYGEEF